MAIKTSQEYKQAISGRKKNRVFKMKADIALADGTILHATDSNIMQNGMSFTDGTSSIDSFSVGGAVIGGCSLVLSNSKDEYSKFDFTGAVISPSIGLKLSETIEWLPKGVFNAENPKYRGSIITLECLDNMSKFEIDFSEVTVTYPTTALSLLQAVCAHCNVTLATTSFTNSDYVVSSTPADTSITCLDVVSWIAQLGGNFARCNNLGKLEIKWYRTDIIDSNPMINGGEFDLTAQASYQTGDSLDGGNFTKYTSGDTADGKSFLDMSAYHHLYSYGTQPQISTDDTEITGINLTYTVTTTDGDTTTSTEMSLDYGTNGYIIYLSGNGLIATTEQAHAVINAIGAKLVGLKFRTFEASQCLSDPSIEAGDIAIISDRKGSYWTIITNLYYTVGQYESMSCGAETKSENNTKRYTATQKAIANVSKTVSNLESKTITKFEQTDDSISAEVKRATDVEGELSSSINLALDTIVLKVDANGRIASIKLGSGITEESYITLSADNINLNGYVTILSLSGSGTTIINGDNITTGEINGVVYKSIPTGKNQGVKIVEGEVYASRIWIARRTPDGVGSYLDGWIGYSSTYGTSELSVGRATIGSSISSPQVYVTAPGTASFAANCRLVESSGAIMYAASSSQRYKKYISENLGELDPSKLYSIPVKKFRYKKGYLASGDIREETDVIGFLVEDIEKVYPIAVDRKENGEPEMWNINILFPAVVKLVQDQKKEIDSLKNRLDTLEALIKEKGAI